MIPIRSLPLLVTLAGAVACSSPVTSGEIAADARFSTAPTPNEAHPDAIVADTTTARNGGLMGGN